MRDIVKSITPYYSGCPIIMVSNPNDILTYAEDRLLGTDNGIATCVCFLADTIIHKRQNIVSVTTPFQGEYGLSGVSLSVPPFIGANGVEKRLEENLYTDEMIKFRRSAKDMKALFDGIVWK